MNEKSDSQVTQNPVEKLSKKLPEITGPIYIPSDNVIYTPETRQKIREWAQAFTQILNDESVLEEEKSAWNNSLLSILDSNDATEYNDMLEQINEVLDADENIPVLVTNEIVLLTGVYRVAKAYITEKDVKTILVLDSELVIAEIFEGEKVDGQLYCDGDHSYSISRLFKLCRGRKCIDIDPIVVLVQNDNVINGVSMIDVVDMIVEGVTHEAGLEHVVSLKDVRDAAKYHDEQREE